MFHKPDINATKVAIVLPCFNAEKHLQECLISISKQTYDNFHVFAVDDGSTDKTGAILDSYSKIDPRFRVIHTPNNGVGSARNTALKLIFQESRAEQSRAEQSRAEQSRYDWVSYIDSDDYVLPTYLEELISSANQNSSDIVCCCYSQFNEKGMITRDQTILPAHTFSRDSFVRLIFNHGEWNNVNGSEGMLWEKIFRASVVHSIRFSEERNSVEDELYCLLAAKKSNNFFYVPKDLYRYRQINTSLIHQQGFLTTLLKGRLCCIPIAKEISNSALSIVLKSVVDITIRQLKCNQEIPTEIFNFKEILQSQVENKAINQHQLNRVIAYCKYPRIIRFLYLCRKLFK